MAQLACSASDCLGRPSSLLCHRMQRLVRQARAHAYSLVPSSAGAKVFSMVASRVPAKSPRQGLSACTQGTTQYPGVSVRADSSACVRCVRQSIHPAGCYGDVCGTFTCVGKQSFSCCRWHLAFASTYRHLVMCCIFGNAQGLEEAPYPRRAALNNPPVYCILVPAQQ